MRAGKGIGCLFLMLWRVGTCSHSAQPLYLVGSLFIARLHTRRLKWGSTVYQVVFALQSHAVRLQPLPWACASTPAPHPDRHVPESILHAKYLHPSRPAHDAVSVTRGWLHCAGFGIHLCKAASVSDQCATSRALVAGLPCDDHKEHVNALSGAGCRHGRRSAALTWKHGAGP